jgi:hypothetical protein
VARYEVSLSWVYGTTALVGAFVGYSALEQMLYRCADELMNMARERRTGRQGQSCLLGEPISCAAREVVGNLVDLAGARSNPTTIRSSGSGVTST